MDYRPIERATRDFQQPVRADEIVTMAQRAFGAGTRVESAIELGGGAYNTTYRVELAGIGPVILRVAPQPARQFRSERGYMRNEHASVPWFAPIADLLPRTLAADFTHQLIGRDWMFQSLLPGEPATVALADVPREDRRPFWRQIGEILSNVHSVTAPAFGAVAGPHHDTWGQAVLASYDAMADDLEACGLDASDLQEARAIAAAHRDVLDEITEPRMLHGDLWIVNVMVDAEQRIVGVYDGDRARWGDPMSDWTVFLADRRPGRESDEIWAAYERPEPTPSSEARALFYKVRNMAEVRLEHFRLHETDAVARSYPDMADVVGELRAL